VVPDDRDLRWGEVVERDGAGVDPCGVVDLVDVPVLFAPADHFAAFADGRADGDVGEAEFLEDFAVGGVAVGFAGLDAAAGEQPEVGSGQWIDAASDGCVVDVQHQDPVGVDEQDAGGGAERRRGRVGHGVRLR